MEDFDVRAEIQRAAAALAEPRRFDLVCRLLPGGRTVGELVAETGWPQPLVSHHLAVLRRAGLVAAVSDGRFHRYSLERARSATIRGLLDLIEGQIGFATDRPTTKSDVDANEKIVSLPSLERAHPFSSERSDRSDRPDRAAEHSTEQSLVRRPESDAQPAAAPATQPPIPAPAEMEDFLL